MTAQRWCYLTDSNAVTNGFIPSQKTAEEKAYRAEQLDGDDGRSVLITWGERSRARGGIL